jgi:hypothetical protein
MSAVFRSTVTQVTDVGKETTEASAIATLTRLSKASIDIAPSLSFEELANMGYVVPTDVIPGKNHAPVTIGRKPAYDELPYFLNGLLVDVSPTVPGGGTLSRLYTYNPRSNREETLATYTARQGSPMSRAHQATGIFWSSYGISWDTDKVDHSGAGMGRLFTDGVQMSTNEVQQLAITGGPPTSGSAAFAGTNPNTGVAFNVTAVTYNMTSTQAQARFDAAIGAGNSVVTGGPWPGAALLVEFRGEFAQANIAALTPSDTFDAGDVAVTTTTAGVAPAETQGLVIRPEHIKIYSDDAHGGLGTTQLLRTFSGGFQINNRQTGVYTVNQDNAGSMAGRVHTPIDGTFSMLLEADAAGMAFYTKARNSTSAFIRWLATGDLIEGALRYFARFDFHIKVNAVNPLQDAGGVYAFPITGRILHSPAWGKFMSAAVQNQLTAVV